MPTIPRPSLRPLKARLRTARDEALAKKAPEAREQSEAAFIGVTGSSGKSTTVALLAHILAGHGRVKTQLKFNNRRATLKTLVHGSRRNDYVVLELGIGGEQPMRPAAQILQPDVAVVTMVELEHKSEFRSKEAVAAEKSELVAALRPGGMALLNRDDPLVMAMADRTDGRIVTFGQSEEADFRATDITVSFPKRLSFTVKWCDQSLSLTTRFVGSHFWMPTLAAAATALSLDVPPQLVAERVATFEPLLERCGVITTQDGPAFILDTTKAPWHSIRLAFDSVQQASAVRKRIVLGHMSDFAGSDQKYRNAYRLAREAADQVIFVGQHAHRSKASQEDRDEGRFVEFRTPEEASAHIRGTAIPGEVILLKGSVDLHLERIALSWIYDVKCWATACGHNSGCLDCGRYESSFDWHKGRKRRGRLKRLWRKSRRKDPLSPPAR